MVCKIRIIALEFQTQTLDDLFNMETSTRTDTKTARGKTESRGKSYLIVDQRKDKLFGGPGV